MTVIENESRDSVITQLPPHIGTLDCLGKPMVTASGADYDSFTCSPGRVRYERNDLLGRRNYAKPHEKGKAYDDCTDVP